MIWTWSCTDDLEALLAAVDTTAVLITAVVITQDCTTPTATDSDAAYPRRLLVDALLKRRRTGRCAILQAIRYTTAVDGA